MGKGILIVAFGSSKQPAHLSLREFEAKVNARFPEVPARWAFTSGVIRTKLADKGKKTDSVTKALQKMWFEKYTHVAVQSLHVIPGDEFHDLLADAKEFENPPTAFERIVVGKPLLADQSDLRRVTQAVFRRIPENRTSGEAVVLMGHGTWHAGDSMYDALYQEIRKIDKLVFVATMDGALTITQVRDELTREGITKAHLVPLLAVAGQHVQNDMAGPSPDSWKSILNAAGIECECVLKGTAEYDEFAEIWLDHLQSAMDGL